MNCSNCSHGIIIMPDGTILHHGLVPDNTNPVFVEESYNLLKTHSGKLCLEGECQCLRPAQ